MYNKNDPSSIQEMFATIAQDYDRANLTLSLGLCNYWNSLLVKKVASKRNLLDLCAGTGEIAARFLKKDPTKKALLVDFSKEMLAIAAQRGLKTLQADASVIPLPDSSFDAITCAYGVRNIQNPMLAFQESYRILQKEGIFSILELTRPQNGLLHLSHHLYLSTIVPLLGKLVTRNKKAYNYLQGSIKSFTSPHEIKNQLEKVGFQKVEIEPLTGGIATIITGRKS